MDRIAVALRSENDEQRVRDLIQKVGFKLPAADFESDPETMHGIFQAREHFGIARMLFLVSDSSDDSSNRVTQETFEQLIMHETTCRLEKLFKHLAHEELESEVWLFFAFCWDVDQEIVYYEGNADAFGVHLRLNGGAFRTTYNLKKGTSNIDLDTPVVWKLRSVG